MGVIGMVPVPMSWISSIVDIPFFRAPHVPESIHHTTNSGSSVAASRLGSSYGGRDLGIGLVVTLGAWNKR